MSFSLTILMFVLKAMFDSKIVVGFVYKSLLILSFAISSHYQHLRRTNIYILIEHVVMIFCNDKITIAMNLDYIMSIILWACVCVKI